MKGRALTLVLPYYRNRGMLREQQAIWSSYPDPLKARLHVIVVDDGSPADEDARAAFAIVPGLASQRLFRIGVDIRWNWLACRNLGMSKASTEWVLLTDMDHAMPVETLHALTSKKLDDAHVYRLSRVDAPHPWPYSLEACTVRRRKDGSIHIHPNTWLMTVDMFDRVGGYDERLSGCYGTDGEFRARVTAAAGVIMRDEPLIRYPREVIADASTVGFTRKHDPDNDAELSRRRLAREAQQGWRPLRLSFPWTLEVEAGEVTP